MIILVDEILNHYSITKGKDKIVKTHIIEEDTFEKCYKKIYALERQSRYDNYRRYNFRDLDIENSYQNWKRHGVTIEMYYGGSVVD
jgi:hypothetical protein